MTASNNKLFFLDSNTSSELPNSSLAISISNLLFGFMISQSIFALIPKDNLSVEVSPSRLLYSLNAYLKSLLLR